MKTKHKRLPRKKKKIVNKWFSYSKATISRGDEKLSSKITFCFLYDMFKQDKEAIRIATTRTNRFLKPKTIKITL